MISNLLEFFKELTKENLLINLGSLLIKIMNKLAFKIKIIKFLIG